MPYVAMSRRYRPAAFDEVVGQEHVAQTLKSAIRTDRVAHAYLFCGPHGCGKTTMARIFAKALNCENGPSESVPDDCAVCRDVAAGNDPDVLEIDGASNNGVEQVRSLREQAGYVPVRARNKVYIIDEVHMLSVPAFNALLKTLEEPPPHVKFILATTEPHKLLETVLSRCQRFDFRLVPPPVLAAKLRALCEDEGIAADDEALEAIATFAAGSVRDGLMLLDQLASYCPDGITREAVERVRGVAGVESVIGLYDAIAGRNSAAALAVVDEVAQRGTGVGDFLDQLIQYGRDLMLILAGGEERNLTTYGPAREAVARHAEAMGLEQALLILDVFTSARVRVRSRALTNPLVPLEMAVARLAGLEGIEAVGTVLARIESLAESGALAGGEAVLPGGPPAAPEKKTDPGADAEGAPSSPAPDVTPAPAAARPGDGPAPQAAPPPTAEPREAAAPPTPADDAAAPAAPADEAAAPVPGPAAPGGAGGNLTLGQVEELWPEVLETVQEVYPPDRHYFADVTPVAVEENELVLELPPGAVWTLEQLDDRDRRRRITEVLRRVLQRPVEYRLVLAEGVAERPGEVSAASKREALEDPVVRDVMDRFKGQLLNIE